MARLLPGNLRTAVFANALPPHSKSSLLELKTLLAEALEFVEQRAAADAQRLGVSVRLDLCCLSAARIACRSISSIVCVSSVNAGAADFAASRNLAGRWSGRINSLCESSTARSMALRSSRTLPGQE